MTSAAVPSLNDIAFHISGLTYNVSKFLEQNNLPALSNAADAPPRFPVFAPAEIQAARHQLLELTLNLHSLILGPEDRIRTQTAEVCVHDTQSSQFANDNLVCSPVSPPLDHAFQNRRTCPAQWQHHLRRSGICSLSA
jgi:hypothetical protein